MLTTSDQIKSTIAEITRLEKIKSHIESVKNRIDGLVKDRQNTETLLTKKQEDVQSLEKMGIRGLFHNILGSKEEELEKERQEFLSVALKHKDQIKQIELDTFELEVLQKNTENLPKLKSELESLKDLREKELLSNPNEEHHEIMKSLYKESDDHEKLKTEIEEAHDAGYKVLQSLKFVDQKLMAAKQWGDYIDGLDYKVKTTVDTALNEAFNCKSLIVKFQKELRDLGISKDELFLDIGQATSFMDSIFQNLISDWVFQKRIKDTLISVSEVYHKITPILAYLESSHASVKAMIEETNRKIDNLVIQ
jgi:hypothetical protein